MRRVFISDCEGPISKNDNAFEVMTHFVPHGERIFAVVSTYDDALADVLKKSGYKAGDTLKLILPFLKAYNVTDRAIRDFSAENLLLIANAKKTLRHVNSIAPTYIVSTSYEHYVRPVCRAMDFPFKNTYCTRLKLDRYDLTETEKEQLKKFCREIAQMSNFDIPPKARSLDDLSNDTRAIIERLDEIFWETIDEMQIGMIYSEVNPIGGCEKVEAINDVVNKLKVKLNDVMYVGDSITDEEALRFIRENGGLAVSFNGNRYAIENADIAVMSEDSVVTAVIADVFIRLGKKETLSLVADWSPQTLVKSLFEQEFVNSFVRAHPFELSKAKMITEENMENLTSASTEFRKKVRGVAVGRMG